MTIPNACTKCGTKTAFTPDWTLWPWPDGAWLCGPCNELRHEAEDYTDVERDVATRVEVESSHGQLVIRAASGDVLPEHSRYDTADYDPESLHPIVRFDVAEYAKTYGAALKGGESVDILDLGCWMNNGTYESASSDWRGEVHDGFAVRAYRFPDARRLQLVRCQDNAPDRLFYVVNAMEAHCGGGFRTRTEANVVAQELRDKAFHPVGKLPIHCPQCAAERGVAIPAVCPHQIDFNVPETYIEWHVIDKATQRSIERCDEPDHALTHRAVAAGTADVVEATVQARIIKHRLVTEDTIGEDE